MVIRTANDFLLISMSRADICDFSAPTLHIQVQEFTKYASSESHCAIVRILFCWLFIRTAKIFLVITTVHNFILRYLGFQMYLESAAQSCWLFLMHVFTISPEIFPLGVGSSFTVSFSDSQCSLTCLIYKLC